MSFKLLAGLERTVFTEHLGAATFLMRCYGNSETWMLSHYVALVKLLPLSGPGIWVAWRGQGIWDG